MNTPNPLIPQGSLLEQKAKGKPHLRVAYFIVAAHMPVSKEICAFQSSTGSGATNAKW